MQVRCSEEPARRNRGRNAKHGKAEEPCQKSPYLAHRMQLSSLLGHTQELLGLVRESDRPADSVINSFFRSHKYLGSHDRRFIAQTMYGSLRHLRRCEAVLQHSLGESARDLKSRDGLLFIAVVYLLNVERTTPLKPEDILPKMLSPMLTQQCSNLLKRISSVGPIVAENPVERIGIEYSFPNWMVRNFINEYGEKETEKICSSLNEQAPLTIRANTLKGSVEQCQAELKREGVASVRTNMSPIGLIIPKRLNVFQLEAFREGLFEVQDEGSQLLPLFVDPKPTAKVLDACAGAGGKSLELAALMNNRGEIFATDRNRFRIQELKKRVRRAGASNIRPLDVNAIDDLHGRYADYFDVVLVDAPCSGIGTIRRNPGMKWTVDELTVKDVSERQKLILQSCSPLVKPGGRLVYATCTMFRQENEEVVEHFLSANPSFTPKNSIEAAKRIGIEGASVDNVVKLMPQKHGTDGFFCAMLEKRVA